MNRARARAVAALAAALLLVVLARGGLGAPPKKELPPPPRPDRDFFGAYAFARYQITRRGYIGARFDTFQDEAAEGRTSTAASGYFQFFPSEFSKLLAGYERYSPAEGSATNRFLLQATFALGPHKPHPF